MCSQQAVPCTWCCDREVDGGRNAAWVLLAQPCTLHPVLPALVEDLVGRAKVMGDGGESHSTEYQGRTKTRSAFWKGPLPAERKLQRREKLEATWEALVVVPARAGRGFEPGGE